jgi:hypothetical protein
VTWPQPALSALRRGARLFAKRHALEIGVAVFGVVVALAVLVWSQAWGEALLGAFLAAGLVSIVYTEVEFQRRRAREQAAIRFVADAARNEVLAAPLHTLSREVYESYDPGPPDTISSLAAQPPDWVTFDAKIHQERWAMITESLRERHDSFVSSVAVYLVDLGDDARRALSEVLRGVRLAASAAWTMDRLWKEMALREGRLQQPDPREWHAVTDPVRALMKQPHRDYREALRAIVDACDRLQLLHSGEPLKEGPSTRNHRQGKSN